MTETLLNPDLDELHDLLVARVNTLSDQLGQTSDIDLARSILTEMREFTHRVDVVQSLLFSAASNKVSKGVANIQTASAALDASLAAIGDVTAFVNACSGFLAVVDQVIDVAKVL
jgi:hypothetical protein